MFDLDPMTALPELFLAVAAMALLLFGVLQGRESTRSVLWLSVVALVVAFVLLVVSQRGTQTAFGGHFVADGFALFMKMLILIGSAVSLIMSLRYVEREGMARFEFPVLMVLATLGMLLMVSASDLIALYLGLEMQSLALYVIAAFRRDTLRSSEAGLKYFVLGALSSGMLLYGASLIYGFAGTTSFAGLADGFRSFAAEGGTPPLGVIVGLVFLFAGLAFKVSAVPFHMWTPDVYEGAPTPVTAFFSTAPKVAAMALFVRVAMGPFGDLLGSWQQIVIAISVASMLLGAFAAINQTNIKRLMAYSSIGHVGYALVGLASGTESGVRGVAFYMAIYLFMNLGTFACILAMRQQDRLVEGIDDLKGLSKSQPMMALAFAIFMFSMAGIPPLAGFFGKLYVFLPAIESGLYVLAVIGVLSSVVSAFYYLRIVKVMYFDEPSDTFDQPVDRELALVAAVSGLLILLFFLAPGAILEGASTAAGSLFPA
ncbi:MAG: NADH-quinone oxidoreductase subunit NuoN [Kiloniellales bacterium]